MLNSLRNSLKLFQKKNLNNSKPNNKANINSEVSFKLIPSLTNLKLRPEKDLNDNIYDTLDKFFNKTDSGDYAISYEDLKNNFLSDLKKMELNEDIARLLKNDFIENINEITESCEEEETTRADEGEGTINLNDSTDEDRKILDYFPRLNFNREFKVRLNISGKEISLQISIKNKEGYSNITDKVQENGLILDLTHGNSKRQSLTVLPYWIYQLFNSYINHKELWTDENPTLIAALQKVHTWQTQYDPDNKMILGDLRISEANIFYFSKFDLYGAKSLDSASHEDLASLIPLNDVLEELLRYVNQEVALKAIQRGMRNWDTDSNLIKINTAEGKTIQLALNPLTKEAIKKLKTEFHHKPSEEIIDKLRYHSKSSILKELPEFSQIFNLDISEYGRRVIGIGKPITIPGQFGKVQQASMTDGMDDLVEPENKDRVSIEEDGFVKINLGQSNTGKETFINLNLDDINLAKEKLKIAYAENSILKLEDSKTKKEEFIDVSSTEAYHDLNSCLNSAKKILHKASSNPDESKSKKEEDLKALIIGTSCEKLDYDERNPYQNENPNLDWTLIDFKEGVHPFPYQKECVQWLSNCFMKEYPGVLLADDMGLGKTFQTMCFIKFLMKDLWQKRFPEEEFTPILIIVPPILLDNFEKQARDFFHDSKEFDFTVIHGSKIAGAKPIKDYFRDTDAKSKPEGKLGYELLDSKLLRQHRCIIMTYDTMVNYEHSLAKIPWSLLLCDEVQKAKSVKTNVTRVLKAISTKATFKILMSGTPVENDMSELWNIMDACHPGLLDALKEFRKKYKAFFNNDVPDIDKQSCFTKLNDVLKFGNYETGYANGRLKSEVRKDLPELIPENINFNLDKDTEESINNIFKSNYAALLKVGLIKQASIHKFLAAGKIYSSPDFHEWFSGCDRLNRLENILEKIKVKNEKVLVFCEYHHYQQAVQDFINHKYGLSLEPINSKLDEINKKDNLAKFQTHKGFSALVLSPRCAGMGLNLQEANHVIHLSRWWNPAVEDQATCRAYRTGQKKNVYVYYFVANHIFEKNLNDRLEIKRATRKNFFDLSYTQNVSGTEILNEMAQNNINENTRIPTLNDMDMIQASNTSEQGRIFENYIRTIFEASGYKVEKPKRRDTGIDFIFIDENNHEIGVQVKNVSGRCEYGDLKAIKSFSETLKDYDLSQGMFITNGTYKDTHKQLMHRMSQEHNIEWIDRYKLAKLIEDLDRN